MNAKDIIGQKFDKAFNGYKLDEVDEFLKEVSVEFSQLQKENRDLEKKLEVLADKIREYRNDEEALKDALLGAQKQGQKAVAEAREKAESIVGKAKNEADEILAAAKEKSGKMLEDGNKFVADAKAESEKIISDAEAEAKRIDDDLKQKVEIQREVLTRTTEEVEDFRGRLLASYKKHIAELEAYPERCENEYITKTVAEHKKNKKPVFTAQESEAPRVKKLIIEEKPAEAKAPVKEEPVVEPPESADGAVQIEAGQGVSDFTAELQFSPIFEEADADKDDVEEFGASSEKKKGEDRFLFKKKPVAKSGNKLEFGANAKPQDGKKT